MPHDHSVIPPPPPEWVGPRDRTAGYAARECSYTPYSPVIQTTIPHFSSSDL